MLLLALTGAGCTKGPDAATLAAAQPKSLTIWGVVDDYDKYAPVLDAYQREYSNVRIDFRRFRLEDYENALLEAFAEDRGPDIFLIHNDWTTKYQSKITPMPSQVQVAAQVVVGSVKKDVVWQMQTVNMPTRGEFKNAHADVVTRDAVRMIAGPGENGVLQERIMGAPIFMDTLALYYNKDLLNRAGIATPPTTWGEFQDQVKRLTRLNPRGGIDQSGAAIGLGSNVERSTDIITALITQNGGDMASPDGRVLFQSVPLNANVNDPPSYEAVRFYTDFANSAKDTYAWNAEQPNSLEAFMAGKTAFFFGYAYQRDLIRAQAPKLSVGVTALPQIDPGNPKNVANYWLWVVAKKSKEPQQSWHLLSYMMQPQKTKQILDLMKRPSARKAFIAEQLRDDDIGVFASQVLTAQSWYTGREPRVMEEALKEMLDLVATGQATIDRAVRFASEKVQQTY